MSSYKFHFPSTLPHSPYAPRLHPAGALPSPATASLPRLYTIPHSHVDNAVADDSCARRHLGPWIMSSLPSLPLAVKVGVKGTTAINIQIRLFPHTLTVA